MTSLNPKPYRVVTDTEMGVVRLGSHETLSGAIYAMGMDHGYDCRVSEEYGEKTLCGAIYAMGMDLGYDNRVSEEYGENPKGVSWIEELVDNEWKKVDLDFI